MEPPTKRKRPVCTIASVLCIVGAVPLGMLAAAHIQFQEDPIGIGAAYTGLGVMVGFCMAALILAGVARVRGETPVWPLYLVLGTCAVIVAWFFIGY